MPMKVGLDVYSIHHLGLGPFEVLHYVQDHRLDGAHFFSARELSPTLDPGRLAEISQEAVRRGLYLEVGIPTINPYKFGDAQGVAVAALGDGDYRRGLERAIRAARSTGCRELRSNIAAREARWSRDWPEWVRASTNMLRELTPLLKELECRIDVETHADATTFELVRLVEEVGPDVAGICLDVGNVFRQLEDPVRATKRAAPYVQITHTKDAILFFTPRGIAWQARPSGQGAVNWAHVLPILGAHHPNLTLSIEDEPYVREFAIFDPEFLAWHPDLSTVELAELVRVARVCQEKLDRGELAEPYAYEKSGWLAAGDSRIDASRAYLKDMVSQLGRQNLSGR
jgi:3-oxoisoapionate decarboxylase